MVQSANVKEIIASIQLANREELGFLEKRYSLDPRAGIVKALIKARRLFDSEDKELARTESLYAEQRLAGPGAIVVGIDEVGRGSVAGPLTVAAVALPLEPLILGLNDSKKLTAQQREKLVPQIRSVALAIGIAHIEAQEIDAKGMSQSLRTAMLAALDATGLKPDLVLIDGVPLHIHEREKCIIKGDGKVACIAAASIIAKVCRDALLVQADAQYPGYGFAGNKGYASVEHIDAIRNKGLSPIHRRSFCEGFFQETLF
jgi:ribonuclease HII